MPLPVHPILDASEQQQRPQVRPDVWLALVKSEQGSERTRSKAPVSMARLEAF